LKKKRLGWYPTPPAPSPTTPTPDAPESGGGGTGGGEGGGEDEAEDETVGPEDGESVFDPEDPTTWGEPPAGPAGIPPGYEDTLSTVGDLEEREPGSEEDEDSLPEERGLVEPTEPVR
jgi:hypothetical protein